MLRGLVRRAGLHGHRVARLARLTVGIPPSVNGLSLHGAHTDRMTLERTEVTTVSRSRMLNYWAWLMPDIPGSPAGSGAMSFPKPSRLIGPAAMAAWRPSRQHKACWARRS